MADQRQKCRTVAILTPAIRLNDLECLPEIAPLIKAQSTSTSGCTQMPVSWQGSMRGACALAAVNYLDRCLRRFLLSLLILFFFHCNEKGRRVSIIQICLTRCSSDFVACSCTCTSSIGADAFMQGSIDRAA